MPNFAVNSRQLNVPILLNRPLNPGVCFTVPPNVRLSAVTVKILGTVNPAALNEVTLVQLPENSAWKRWEESNTVPTVAQISGSTLTLSADVRTGDSPATFWILIGISDTADLAATVSLTLIHVMCDGKPLCPRSSEPGVRLRLGYRLRHAGDDGSASYRIPGLATTNDGTLLAVYDIRRESNRDLQGDIDIGLSRSTDGGQNWEPIRVALDMGEWGGLPEKYNGVSDPCITVDRVTGDIFVFACWMHGLRTDAGAFRENLSEESTDWAHQWHSGRCGSGPGMTPRETSQFLMARSTDDGKTWSEPVSLTPMLKDADWFLLCPAPGNGITMRDGTLVIPAQGRESEAGRFSTIAVSRDHGESWELGTPAQNGTNECAVVELADGELMLNMRDPDNRERPPELRARGVSTTRDLGTTWERHPSDHCPDLLPEPVCMGSLFQAELGDGAGNTVLLFTNPDNREARKNMTIKTSFDAGMTWPLDAKVELDELQSAGYSCMTQVDAGHVGILYESSQGHLVFQKVAIGDLTPG